MIYASLRVGRSPADKAVPPFYNTEATHDNAVFPINGRLSVLDGSINRDAFDTVQLSLRGALSPEIRLMIA